MSRYDVQEQVKMNKCIVVLANEPTMEFGLTDSVPVFHHRNSGVPVGIVHL